MFQNFVGNKKSKKKTRPQLILDEVVEYGSTKNMALLEINHDDIKFGVTTPKPSSGNYMTNFGYSKKFKQFAKDL